METYKETTKKSKYHSKLIQHPGIVSGLCNEVKLAEYFVNRSVETLIEKDRIAAFKSLYIDAKKKGSAVVKKYTPVYMDYIRSKDIPTDEYNTIDDIIKEINEEREGYIQGKSGAAR
jgi:hypothetical protein